MCESLARSGARQPGAVRVISFAKNGNRGLKSTASSLHSAAFRRNVHTGIRTKPFRAADEKIPLSVVLVKKKPQYLVFCYHSGHLLAKQRGLPVESRKHPCWARIPAARSASNPVQAQVSRPVPVLYTSLVLAGAGGKTRKWCSLGARLCELWRLRQFQDGWNGDRETRAASSSPGSPATGLDDNRLRIAQPSESTFAYRTITDLQKSGGDLQLVDSIGVPDGI